MIAEKIRKMLEIRGMSQMDLARVANLSKSTVNGLATGSLKNTSVETLKLIAKVLNVNPAYFLDDDVVTPFDILADVPEDVREFMLTLENVPYLKLSQKAKDHGITPDMIDGLLDTLVQAMNRHKSTHKE